MPNRLKSYGHNQEMNMHQSLYHYNGKEILSFRKQYFSCRTETVGRFIRLAGMITTPENQKLVNRELKSEDIYFRYQIHHAKH